MDYQEIKTLREILQMLIALADYEETNNNDSCRVYEKYLLEKRLQRIEEKIGIEHKE